MSDYDLQIMVAVIFAGILFSGFMFFYAQEPTVDYIPEINESDTWDDPQSGIEIQNIFSLISSFNDVEIFLVSLFVSAMAIVGVVIVARYLRGQ